MKRSKIHPKNRIRFNSAISLLCLFVVFVPAITLYLNSHYDLRSPPELSLILDFPTPQYGAADFQPWIDGKFNVIGKCTLETICLLLFLDQNLLENTSTSDLYYELDTRLYPPGMLNLTLIVFLEGRETLQKARILYSVRNLMSKSLTVFLSVDIGFVIISLYCYKKTKDKSSHKVSKEDILIEEI